MHGVDAVKEVILVVPTEGAEKHAKIQPGVGDSFHDFIQHCQQGMRLLVQIVQVPGADGIGRILKSRAIPAGKTFRSILKHLDQPSANAVPSHIPLGVQIISVVNCNLLLRGSFNNAPACNTELLSLQEGEAEEQDGKAMELPVLFFQYFSSSISGVARNSFFLQMARWLTVQY